MKKGKLIGLRWAAEFYNEMRLIKAIRFGAGRTPERFFFFELGFNFLDWSLPLGLVVWNDDEEYPGMIAMEIKLLFLFLTLCLPKGEGESISIVSEEAQTTEEDRQRREAIMALDAGILVGTLWVQRLICYLMGAGGKVKRDEIIKRLGSPELLDEVIKPLVNGGDIQEEDGFIILAEDSFWWDWELDYC